MDNSLYDATILLTAADEQPIVPSVVMPARVLANAAAVASYAGTLDRARPRRSFLEALVRLQHLQADLSPEKDCVTVVFDTMNAIEAEALCRIMAINELPRDWRYAAEARALAVSRIQEAFEIIERALPAVHSTIQTIIGTLLMARLPGFEGGSVSSVIGAIWVALDPARPAVDFAELIVHEYVHHCLFLEDMVHAVFVDGEERLAEDDAVVTSAILRIPRGYDKSFHSAFVAVVLAELNRHLGRHERHASFLAPVPTTLHGLTKRKQFLTQPGQSLLEELIAWVKTHPLEAAPVETL